MDNDKLFKDTLKKLNADPAARVKEGYVIMLDVLGFRDLMSKRFGNTFFKIWADIKKSLLDKKEGLEKKIKPLDIDVLCLSDTLVVCISMKTRNKIDPRILLSLIPQLIDCFFWEQFTNRVFFRGAISYGKYQCDTANNIAMGEAIEEAYDWHSLSEWIGIVLTPSALYAKEKYIIENPNDNDICTIMNDRFVEYSVPFKESKTYKTNACVWFKVLKDKNKNQELLAKVLLVFSGIKHLHSVATKYSNTLKFIKTQLDLK
ncbi:MAG: hypothetical protein BWY95_01553 [Bacteroidetes bacterium ADurb.BinA104]|jgi:hypothetical protein|nr:MAG: hypothetical protein BWY95_01553 [Bacteroidetes bacterium ADurb.BinA104]HNV66899.1 hypothetical protein [Bacteroidales bacterium]